jgi:GNAT superfamily N-acetyltransferase
MSISIRPASLPQDYGRIADVLEDENPGWAATAEELAHEDTERDPHYHHATFVAEEFGAAEPLMVGVGFVGHDIMAHQEGKFAIDLRVRQVWQGRGVGRALYDRILEHLAPFEPRELCAMVWQAHPRAPRFLTDRGFAAAWQRVDSYLDVANFDFTPYAGLEQRLKDAGITITTYADLAGDPDRLGKLHELDWALWQDVPYGQPVRKRTLEQFAAAEVDHPRSLHDACFIAIKDSDYVGYSRLIEADEGFSTDMTGVLRAYRGMGLATLLKLRGIRYTQEHGGRRIWVVNDAVNAAMLGLNEKLGFVREGAMVRFVKHLT